MILRFYTWIISSTVLCFILPRTFENKNLQRDGFSEGLYFSPKTKHIELQNQNKDNEIYHGRGNSLRDKVRGWEELDSARPNLNLLPTG